ncbi:hypothetical protein GYMLUDRAFT_73098 [Collybiopsis luxurians FD-317 M1]|uniref:Uncharacterized protein n=1 Tax=Collybiopsis luxurians FD-317 M1 TaxID=944289 RepID=A0A0D0CG63_9AGAR|nr:hypothetical protein GYMLUDRAFT_73098 [Collybiopsis luxurians FD-317 M1]
MSQSNVNVSLERHLASALEPLLPLISDEELSSQLAQHLQRKDFIPYSLLHSISRWSRSPAGSNALKSSSPPLDPNTYSIIALLAGTTSSPERNFGPYSPPEEPEKIALQKKQERKAITAIINGLLSVIGAGAAAWLGSDKTNWRQEWRVLFALSVAVIVAFSEIVLYIIWQSRSSSSSGTRKVRRKYLRAKKEDGENPSAGSADDEMPEGLRLRVNANSKNST